MSIYGVTNQIGDIPRPRRPIPGDLQYLQSLPLSFTPGDPGEKSKSVCAARAALTSLASSLASVGGDERGSAALESCIALGLSPDPQAEDGLTDEEEVATLATDVVASVAEYAHFLALNRYGSHVLQCVIELLPPLVSKAVASHQGDEASAPLIQATARLVDALRGPFPQLVTHISGSHIIRSLLPILAGVPPSSLEDRRGTKSKHSHKGSASLVVKHALYPYNPLYRTTFEPELFSFVATLLEMDASQPGYLRDLAMNPSGCGLLQTLLRVVALTEAGDAERGAEQSDDIYSAGRLGEVDSAAFPKCGEKGLEIISAIMFLNTSDAANAISGLAKNQSGSSIVECILEVSPIDTLRSIYAAGVKGNVHALIDDNVGNYVVQGMLAHGDAELVKELLGEVISCSRVSQKDRRGVLFRALDACVKYSLMQERFFNFVSPLDIPSLFAAVLPEKEGGRLTLDVNGGRAVNRLLRFDGVWRNKVVDAVIKAVDGRLLKAMAMDGASSKVVVEGVLTAGGGAAADWMRGLTKSDLVDLACHHWGKFYVRKLFKASTAEGKSDIAMELSGSMSRLGGNKQGREVQDACCVEAFLEGKEAFGRELERRSRLEGFVDDVVGASGEKGEGGGEEGGKRKRKRKKKGGEGGVGGDEGGEEEKEESTEKKAESTEKKAESAKKLTKVDAMVGVLLGAPAEKKEKKEKKQKKQKKEKETTSTE
jgi:hypothetical protein